MSHNTAFIGSQDSPVRHHKGPQADVRITRGVARYTANHASRGAVSRSLTNNPLRRVFFFSYQESIHESFIRENQAP